MDTLRKGDKIKLKQPRIICYLRDPFKISMYSPRKIRPTTLIPVEEYFVTVGTLTKDDIGDGILYVKPKYCKVEFQFYREDVDWISDDDFKKFKQKTKRK